ncbi:hypothetical protein chiPu_0021179, partial [Chiloscyllium punctatum]|nr:hypothetical protein [Chiloscyllium punctatum]
MPFESVLPPILLRPLLGQSSARARSRDMGSRTNQTERPSNFLANQQRPE